MSYKENIFKQDSLRVNNELSNNRAWIYGVIESELEFSHQYYWEIFYKTRVIVTRLSGTLDYVPVLISNFLLKDEPNSLKAGMYVEIVGQFRSYNIVGEDKKTHLKLSLFATSINAYGENEEDYDEIESSNLIYLDGNLSKTPTYRLTPFGRKISDIMLAVKRNCNKQDYIPCIAWGRVAQYLSTAEIGDRIQLYGRIQSREYFKRYSQDSDEGENRIAYEVSILRLRKLE